MTVYPSTSTGGLWTSPFIRLVLLAAGLVLFLQHLAANQAVIDSAWTKVSKKTHKAPKSAKPQLAFQDAGNSTMGFEKLVVINLPARSDRRDKMTLIAAETGMDIVWSDALKGEDVDTRAMPPHWDPSIAIGNLGSYRAHMNAIRMIVENRWSTAIIMEDDIDWSVGIKEQLSLFAPNLRSMVRTGARSLAEEKNRTQTGPYGLDWDILWIGSCIRPDPPEGAHSYYDPIMEENVFVWDVDGGAACTFAYGLTYESAKTLLAYGLDLNMPWDLLITHFCRAHICAFMSPAFVGYHEEVGLFSKSSDISPKGKEWRDVAVSVGVKHSALYAATNNIEPKMEFAPGPPPWARSDEEESKKDDDDTK